MAQVTYQIDPAHSGAHFSVRHMMISNVRGEFSKVSGKVVWDAENPSNSSVEASIDAASINTRDGQRDGHLKSPDFLDVEKFPTLEFRSTKVQSNDGDIQVTGDLTIHGVTRSVVLKVEDLTPEQKSTFRNALKAELLARRMS